MYLWAAVMVEAGVRQLTAQDGAMAGVQDGEVIGLMEVLITDLIKVTMLLQWSLIYRLLSLWFWQHNRSPQFGITAKLVPSIFPMCKSAPLAGKLNLQCHQLVMLSLNGRNTKNDSEYFKV
jgi:hypothetical protein